MAVAELGARRMTAFLTLPKTSALWRASHLPGQSRQRGEGDGVGCLFASAPPDMPKLKTRKAAAKRFQATGSGKFMRRRAFRSHLLDHKSPKRKRYLGTMAVVDERDADNVSAMLPYA
jgi:large subunit ribosomal protein L35